MPASIIDMLEPILDDVSNGVTVADATVPELPLIFANKAFLRITGYSLEESLGHNCRFLQGEGTDQGELEKLRRALRAGEACHLLLRNYRKDRTAFLNELKIKPVTNPEGQLTHFIGIQNDVTAVLVARALQRSLGSSQKPTDLYSLSLPEVQNGLRRPPEILGVVVSDHRGEIRYANPTFASLARRPSGQLLSTSIFEHLDCDWLGEAMISQKIREHEWQPAILTSDDADRVELSHYRVLPELSSPPLHVLLVRPSELLKTAQDEAVSDGPAHLSPPNS